MSFSTVGGPVTSEIQGNASYKLKLKGDDEIHLILEGVVYLPGTGSNLWSLALLMDAGHQINFQKQILSLKDGGKIPFKRVGNLYIVETESLKGVQRERSTCTRRGISTAVETDFEQGGENLNSSEVCRCCGGIDHPTSKHKSTSLCSMSSEDQLDFCCVCQAKNGDPIGSAHCTTLNLQSAATLLALTTNLVCASVLEASGLTAVLEAKDWLSKLSRDQNEQMLAHSSFVLGARWSDDQRAHYRFGHMNSKYMDVLRKSGVSTGLKLTESGAKRFHCPSCAVSKASRPVFGSSSTEYEVGELICTDQYGPFREPGVGGKETYSIHFTCAQSRFTQVYLKTSKGDVLKYFKHFHRNLCQATGKTVRRLQTDNAQEYLSNAMQSYCVENGIQMQQSGPYMHESNGKAERVWRSLNTMAATFLTTAQLPLDYWGFALKHACFIRNRMPHRMTENWSCPFEQWYGRKPDLTAVRTFGCLAYKFVDTDVRKKMENTAVSRIYIGHSNTSNTFKLFNPATKTVEHSGMVRFVERMDIHGRLVTTFDRAEFTAQQYWELFDTSSPINQSEAASGSGLQTDNAAGSNGNSTFNVQPEEPHPVQINSPADHPRRAKVPLSSITALVDNAKLVNLQTLGVCESKGVMHAVCYISYTSDGKSYEGWVDLGKLMRRVVSTAGRYRDTTLFASVTKKILQDNFADLRDEHAPLFTKTTVNWEDESGTSRLVAVITSLDLDRTDSCYYYCTFSDGSQAWIRADEFQTPLSDKSQGHVALQSLLTSNATQILASSTRWRMTTDWKFNAIEFQKFQKLFQHDVDGCCNENGNNAQLAKFWSNALQENWVGMCVWCNPPFHLVAKFLQHFIAARRIDPEHTHATFVVPYSPDKIWWPLLLMHFEIIKFYPAGTRLFTGSPLHDPRRRTDWGPTRVPIVVMHSKPVEFIPGFNDLQGQGGDKPVKLCTNGVVGDELFFLQDNFGNPVGESGFTKSTTNRLFMTVDDKGNHIPRTLREAKTLPEPEKQKWLEAWRIELDALLKFNIGTLVPVLPGMKVLKSISVFRIKYKDGKYLKHKARFVACGYSQLFGEHFNETYAPVAQLPAVRMLLALCAQFELKAYHIDFENAFLQSDLEEVIYVALPAGGEQTDSQGRTLCLKLHKSLYGLKQSPRNWSKKLFSFLKRYGFEQNKSEPCMFSYERNGVKCYLCTYVDDVPVGCNNQKFMEKFLEDLKKEFVVGDVTDLEWLLQLKVTRPNSSTICLSQHQYILDVLKRFRMEDCLPQQFPLNPSFEIKSGERPPEDSKEHAELSELPYSQLVGCLNWLARGTRPDIALAVSILGRFNNCYTLTHWKALKGVLRYLKGTADLGLTFSKSKDFQLCAWSDSDWGTDAIDRKSQSGYIISLANAPVDWGSKKQAGYPALSSVEAEFYALTYCGKGVLALKHMLESLELSGGSVQLYNKGEIPLYCDSSGAISLAQNPLSSEKTKHIKEVFIRELHESGDVKLIKVAGDLNPAHVLASKNYPSALRFTSLRNKFLTVVV